MLIFYDNDQFLLGAFFLLLGSILFRKVLLNDLKKINFFKCIKLVIISLILIFLFLYMLSYLLFNQGIEINDASFILKYATLFLSSVLFSIGHQTVLSSNFYMFWTYIILGLCLGYIYIKTENIWYSITVHFAYNFIVMLVLLY